MWNDLFVLSPIRVKSCKKLQDSEIAWKTYGSKTQPYPTDWHMAWLVIMVVRVCKRSAIFSCQWRSFDIWCLCFQVLLLNPKSYIAITASTWTVWREGVGLRMSLSPSPTSVLTRLEGKSFQIFFLRVATTHTHTYKSIWIVVLHINMPNTKAT